MANDTGLALRKCFIIDDVILDHTFLSCTYHYNVMCSCCESTTSPFQYHGSMIGYQNLYILDGSTDPRCVSFLRYARDILRANVIFSAANLNQLETIIQDLAANIAGSSDLIVKIDTDEFIGVYDEVSGELKPNLQEYLKGFAANSTHPLRRETTSFNQRVGYLQGSIPDKDVCMKDMYASVSEFRLAKILEISDADSWWFKGVFDSRLVHRNKIGLGGHAHSIKKSPTSDIGFFHFHSKCLEVEQQNNKKAILQHGYINAHDDDNTIKSKLAKLLKCSVDEACTACVQGEPTFASNHKVRGFLRYLGCPKEVENEYYGYGRKNVTGVFNTAFSNYVHDATDAYSIAIDADVSNV